MNYIISLKNNIKSFNNTSDKPVPVTGGQTSNSLMSTGGPAGGPKKDPDKSKEGSKEDKKNSKKRPQTHFSAFKSYLADNAEYILLGMGLGLICAGLAMSLLMFIGELPAKTTRGRRGQNANANMLSNVISKPSYVPSGPGIKYNRLTGTVTIYPLPKR